MAGNEVQGQTPWSWPKDTVLPRPMTKGQGEVHYRAGLWPNG